MFEFLKRFRPYLKDYTWRFVQAGLGSLVVAGAQAALMLLIKPILDGVFIEGDTHLHRVLPPLVVGIYLLLGLGRYVQKYQLAWIGEDMVRRLRDRLLGHMLELELDFFSRARGGELISRITNDINRVRAAVSHQLAEIIREAFVIVGLVAVVFYRDPLLATIGLIVIPGAAWPVSRLARRVKRFSHRSQEKDSDITSRLAEVFNNVEIIKAHHSEAFELERFMVDNKQFRSLNMKGVRAREITTPLMELLGSVAVALVIWFGGHQIIEGRMTTGEFTSFASALFMLYTPVKRISVFYNAMFDAVAASERIFTLLGREPTICGGATVPGDTIERIALEEVGLRYGETRALEHVDLELRKGDTVGLVGDSGGGKSSLVNLLLRLYDPSEGRVLVNGVDLREVDLEWLRSRIGIVTQRMYIFNDTVAANVAYGSPLDRERVQQALEQAHAWDFVQRMAAGMDTMLDEFGSNLSGGQRQRLAIARAIYKDPDVLILDEATSALDKHAEATVNRALSELVRGRITLVIAHRLAATGLTTRILVISAGRIVGQGSHDELLDSCPDYRRLVSAGEELAQG